MPIKNLKLINLNITQKLTVSYLFIGLVLLMVLSIIFYYIFKNSLLDRTFDQLSSINILKKSHLEDYFSNQKKKINSIINQTEFQKYINRKNKDSLEQFIKPYKKTFGFEDIIIYSNNNKKIYSSFNHKNLKQLFHKERYNDTIQKFINKCKKNYRVKDFSGIFKEKNIYLFYGMPIHLNNNKKGVILLQKKFDKVEAILYERTGMGKTGESYIVGKDRYMRSHSRFFPEKNPLNIKVNTVGVNHAFAGKKDFQVIDDYRGIKVLSVFRKININGLNWVILSEIDHHEAMVPIYNVRNYIIIGALVLFLLILELTYYFSRNISSPVINLRNTIYELSEGKLPDKPISNNSSDEIGQMKQALDKLIKGLKRTSSFAYEIGKGNFQTNFSPLSENDVLGLSLLKMRDQLKLLKEQEEKLRKQRAMGLIEGQEEERKRISRELHDSIGQMLNAVRMRVGFLKGQDKGKEDIKNIIDETIAEVRRMSNNLMPNILLDFGLEAALKKLSDDTSKLAEIPVNFNYIKEDNQSDADLNFDECICIYRIAQEGLNNTLKYAEATEINLIIRQSRDRITLNLEDDGKGFDPYQYMEKNKQSNGLKNMQERTHILNGNFSIDAKPGNGTAIKVEIPLNNTSNYENN